MFVAVTLKSESGDTYTIAARGSTVGAIVEDLSNAVGEEFTWCYNEGIDSISEEGDLFSVEDVDNALDARLEAAREEKYD